MPADSRMDRARCLATLRRMDRSWLALFLPPSWHLALGRAVELLEADTRASFVEAHSGAGGEPPG